MLVVKGVVVPQELQNVRVFLREELCKLMVERKSVCDCECYRSFSGEFVYICMSSNTGRGIQYFCIAVCNMAAEAIMYFAHKVGGVYIGACLEEFRGDLFKKCFQCVFVEGNFISHVS